MQQVTLKKIASLVHGECRGDAGVIITGITPIQNASPGTVTFLHNPKYKKYLNTTKASAVLLTERDSKDCYTNKIIVPDPYLAYALISVLFDRSSVVTKGIHERACVDPDVVIHSSICVGSQSVIKRGSHIGANTVIGSSVVIGANVSIGSDCHIHDHVTLYDGVTIGDRVIVHSGTVIGADGFGYANQNGKWIKIYQLGKVVIHDDVEIGANTTIDCGALDDTIIGKGVKIDNQVQIGHNVVIGDNTIIAGCTAIAGSTTIGKNCMVGGSVAFNGHITLTDGVIITGGSAVGGSIDEPGVYSSGIPAEKSNKWRRIAFYIKNLDKYIDIIKKLNKNNLD